MLWSFIDAVIDGGRVSSSGGIVYYILTPYKDTQLQVNVLRRVQHFKNMNLAKT